MATCREVLDQIIEAEAGYIQQKGAPPTVLKLPIQLAHDLEKCGRNELGELSARIIKDGISILERVGFRGMKVEIVRDQSTSIVLE